MLDNIRVLEVGGFISAPFCTMLLADLGAEVIKVESPDGGDAFRAWEPDLGDSPTFRSYNRSKKSMTLDISESRGREIFSKLVAKSDVVVENLRPGKMETLGLGYKELSNINPKIVFCAISCFGTTGGYSSNPGFDALAQAMSGWLSLITDRKNPTPVGPAIADQASGLFAAYGILGALMERGKTGKGAYLEISMLESCIQMCCADLQHQLTTGKIQISSSRPHRSQSYGFIGSDGLPFVIHLSNPTKFWQGLLRATGLEDWITSKKYAVYAERIQKYDEIRGHLQAIFSTKPRAHWLQKLQQQDVPCAPVYNTGEVFQDSTIAQMGIVGYTDGKPHILNPVRADWTKRNAGNPPKLGENTESILRDLNLDSDAESLRKEKII